MRQFKAVPMPDFEKRKFETLPSDRPLTQANKPMFYADFLPKKEKILQEKSSNSPQDFKF